MRNDGLDEAQAGITIATSNINGLRYADDTTFMAEREELKSLFGEGNGNSLQYFCLEHLIVGGAW